MVLEDDLPQYDGTKRAHSKGPSMTATRLTHPGGVVVVEANWADCHISWRLITQQLPHSNFMPSFPSRGLFRC